MVGGVLGRPLHAVAAAPDSGQLRVAVLGEHANPSVRNIVAGLQRHGADPWVFDLRDVSVGATGTLLHRGAPMPVLDAAIGYHGALLPTGGLAKMRALQRQGTAMVNDAASIRDSRDKWLTADKLQQAGIAHPRSVLVRSGDEANRAIDEHGLSMPLILKLRVGTEGKGVAKISSRSEVAPVVDMVTAARRNVVLQQMIRMEGPPSDVRAFVVDDEVVASMERTAPPAAGRAAASGEGDFRANMSNGGSARPLELPGADRQTAIDTARALGLKVAGVDLMGGPGSRQAVEANSGPGQKIIEVTGVDVADHIARLAIREAEAARLGAATLG